MTGKMEGVWKSWVWFVRFYLFAAVVLARQVWYGGWGRRGRREEVEMGRGDCGSEVTGVVVVTGGGRGIGKEVVKCLVREGVKVVRGRTRVGKEEGQ